MRIAVTYDYDSGEVFQHFGKTEHFLLVDKRENDIVEMIVDNGGNSHHLLVDYLSHLEVEVLICGGLGMHAINLLSDANIKVIPGITGSAKEAVEKYLKGELVGDYNVTNNCDCHHHDN